MTETEAQEVADHPRPPFPREVPGEKVLVWGRTRAGRYLQVVYFYLSDEEVDFRSLSPFDQLRFQDGEAEVAFVIYAMELTADQK